MTLEEQEHSCTAAISSNEPRQSEVQELRDQVAMLTEQIAALTTAAVFQVQQAGTHPA